GYLGSLMDYGQGFDVYFQSQNEERVWQALLDFLDVNADAIKGMNGGGLFLFIHLFDPHSPYVNHAPRLVRNKGLWGTVDITSAEHLRPLKEHTFQLGKDYQADDLDYIRAVYDWEVIHTDVLVGKIMARLRWLGLYDTCNIVFTADHGEAFGENGQWAHSHGFETCTGIPLVLRFPGVVSPGVDRTSLASNLDIMPTLLSLAGGAMPEGLEGRNLLDPTAQGVTAQYGISEDRRHGWLTMRDERYKLIVSGANAWTDGPQWALGGPESEAVYRLFDLETDPGEERDLSGQKPEVLGAMKARLMEHCERVGIVGSGVQGRSKHEQTVVEISADTRRKLEALGYFD
ncbi:MAG TPA: hypothetical protein ENN80_12230, partial [Candidatus Hydrogenedentes bacterium]|nr:hypothetical protein [Candidatus Hydrogenedentota bacterium]